MEFEKNVLFLGIMSNKLSDGGIYHTVQMFDQSFGPVTVNVMGNAVNADLIGVLNSLKFGDTIAATFVLRPKDKLFKLGLSRVSF